ncbi:VOC family protein [Cupriavidus sp. BIC8F]|uniref:VOC family protein n=1 Tax=Cupriavidus sp. BIC8F TaxID=3079014 RepID=UPI002916FA11|nr:VOC family protein [Cupriavidus sp. BIC8F]
MSSNNSETPVPRAFNHVGLTVPDIDRAIAWYGAVFGFQLIYRRTIELTPGVPEVAEIFGPRFEKAYQAHLVTANGVGLELFQFITPAVEPREDTFKYWRQGVFHLCFTDPDLGGLAARIVANGGKQRTKVWTFLPDRPYQLVYCEDCFGNVIEGFSHSYAKVFSSMPGWHGARNAA